MAFLFFRDYSESESPFRGVPPLVFLEDSDRTVSDDEELSGSYGINPPRITFLSPVLEGSKLEDTSSELSSLPVDGRIEFCGCESYPSSVDQTTYVCEDEPTRWIICFVVKVSVTRAAEISGTTSMSIRKEVEALICARDGGISRMCDGQIFVYFKSMQLWNSSSSSLSAD
ncbi:UNVERIFIED_CONTAM: hypothetical protein PYX00_005640 [Menopon gallinae]|uniref:Uncharacterized protein n=1 Tax=Menopon gallinae TaxID=328185 RepID=A0AAW2HSA2_9NEOP